MPSLYISDLDGTLLRSNATVSDFTRQWLTALLRKGIDFTFATARSVVSSRLILGNLPFRLPVIEFNGAYISDYATGRHDVVNALPRDICRSLLWEIARHDLAPFISGCDGSQDRLYYSGVINPGMAWYLNDRMTKKDPRLLSLPKLSAALNDQIVALTVIGRREELTELDERIEKTFGESVQRYLFENRYSPTWWWLTLHDRAATKGHAIMTLLQRMGRTPLELTVFGDEDNDGGMFRAAGRSVAVANATVDLKQIATFVTGSNDDDSVIKFILQDLGVWESLPE